MFTGCACCDCVSGSSASNQVLDVLRSARLCEMSYTDNGLLPLLQLRQSPTWQSDELPPTTLQLALDLGFTSGVKFSGGSPSSGRYYIASVVFDVSSDLDERFSTALFANNCRLAVSANLRFVRVNPSDGSIWHYIDVDPQFPSLNIDDNFSAIWQSTTSILVSGTSFTSVNPRRLSEWLPAISPMGIRLEF